MRKLLDLLFVSVIVVFSSSCNIDEEKTTSLPPKIILDSETGVYTVKQGREIVIAPSYESAEGATYSWIMDGRLLGTSASLSFEREIVGEYAASQTRDIRLENHILYISVGSSVLRNELFFRRDHLMQLLNERAGLRLINAIIVR